MKVTVPVVILMKDEVAYDTYDAEGVLITVETTIPTKIIIGRSVMTFDVDEILRADRFGEYFIVKETEQGFIAIERSIRDEIMHDLKHQREIIT